MKTSLADSSLRYLSEIGQALDIGRPVAVFDGGRVGFPDPEDQKDAHHESEGTRGSPAGSGQGPAGRQGPAGSGSRIGSNSLEGLYRQGIAPLTSAYPAQVIDDPNGLWVTARTKPLGARGPQAFLAVGFPFNPSLAPRGWAFWRLGEMARPIGPRHTNFPDASICAFGPNDGAWFPEDGPAALLDLYSTWALRHLYFAQFGTWPGRQHGPTALYRRNEFHAEEWCGCGEPKRYKDCHQASDIAKPSEEAELEFRTAMGMDYGERRPPKSVMRFARSSWRKVPTLEDAFNRR